MMKKMILTTAVLSLNTFGAWQPTDGSIDFTCGNGKENFTFNAFYNDQATDIELAYDISLVQFPFVGAEITSVSQPIPGCQKAPLTITPTAVGADIYFECAGDGDAGYGTITTDFNTMKIELEITFPEGQWSLLYPYSEGTTFTLPCDFAL